MANFQLDDKVAISRQPPLPSADLGRSWFGCVRGSALDDLCGVSTEPFALGRHKDGGSLELPSPNTRSGLGLGSILLFWLRSGLWR